MVLATCYTEPDTIRQMNAPSGRTVEAKDGGRMGGADVKLTKLTSKGG